MTAPLRLLTPRLTLRDITPADKPALHAMFNDAAVMRYYEGFKTEAQTDQWIQWNMGLYASHGHGLWIIESRENGSFLGQASIVNQTIEGAAEKELGYMLRSQCWGQGYATEAAIACRDDAFTRLQLPRIVSQIDALNAPSRRVAERVGLRLEKHIWKWEKDVCLYAISH